MRHNALYPYNHVFGSESGHIGEYDDTANNTRIHERHVSGASYEIDHLGNKTDLVVSDHYNIIVVIVKHLLQVAKTFY